MPAMPRLWERAMPAIFLGLSALHALTADADPASAERGLYIATASNCTSCHTRADGEPFAGGVAITTPLGTIHSTNITPDPQTGIGNWTAADLARALREGIAA